MAAEYTSTPDRSGLEPGPDGHLAYYLKHAISPVRYATEDLRAHMERRDSLYRSLGLPPVALKGANILEVAPGSGQNSIYIASCHPASLTLVEPNPAGLNDIAAAYAPLEITHTAPTLVPDTFQAFSPGRQYDVVICENWLGSLPAEVSLIGKLASLVAPGGVMVITVVPVAGFFPNVMRKLLALRLVSEEQDFETQTSLLVDAFGPHLATMEHMTRSHRHWVQDCMINPHYLNVALPLATVLGAIGEQLEALATMPRFTSDWRWFKALAGENRQFNQRLLDAEAANLPNFIDHRRHFPPGDAHTNQALNHVFTELHMLALRWQAASASKDAGRMTDLSGEIADKLALAQSRLAAIDAGLGAAVEELREVWLRPALTIADVGKMREFGPLFGRETVYLSLTRPGCPAPGPG